MSMQPMRLTLVALATAALLAACGSTSPGGSHQPADAADADITVTATDMAFAPGTITIAAGATTLAFVNDDAMPHNLAIYADESKSEKLFEGEMVTDGTVLYELPALEPGKYFVDCSLHPGMTAALVVEG